MELWFLSWNLETIRLDATLYKYHNKIFLECQRCIIPFTHSAMTTFVEEWWILYCLYLNWFSNQFNIKSRFRKMPARPHFVRAGSYIICFARIIILSAENRSIFANVKQAKSVENIRFSTHKSSMKKHPSKNFALFRHFRQVFWLVIEYIFSQFRPYIKLNISKNWIYNNLSVIPSAISAT